jgi:sucrose-6-phosphate hydrolase SacC (GH32 family)
MPGLRFPRIVSFSIICLLGCGTSDQNPLNLPYAAPSTWQRQGTIMTGTAAEDYSVQEPTVIYEGASVLFPGQSPVFKMWHTCGWVVANACYAESTDGFNFTRYNGGQPIINGIGRPFVLHIGSTYYLYAGPEVNGQAWNRYESTDGVQWKMTGNQVLTIGDASWDTLATGNIYIWTENSTWYAIFEALGTDKLWRMGLATSPDGITWTKYANNPVISFPYCGGPEVHKIADTYYMWAQCNQTTTTSSDIYRLSSTDLHTWTPELIELSRQTYDEGVGDNVNGQVADPSMLEINGMVYMYYDATRTQSPTSTAAIHLKLAVANMSFASLIGLK